MSAAGPPPEAFLSGRVGHVGPRRAVVMRAFDRLLDLELKVRRVPAELDRLAEVAPERSVLAVSAYRPGSARIETIAEELRRSRHRVRLALGSMAAATTPRAALGLGAAPPAVTQRAAPGPGAESPAAAPRAALVLGAEPPAALVRHTLAQGLSGGKFQNLDLLLRAAAPADYDWLLLVDDDVVLPEGFVDRLLGVCERLQLELAQPAQTLASNAAWPVTRRRPLTVARETGFVEIGPVTALRRDVAVELTPFPPLRFGWGLDLHWAALARERGWRLGVVDALPVRHDEAGVAAAYSHADAVSEARAFLAERRYVPSSEAGRTLAAHRRLG